MSSFIRRAAAAALAGAMALGIAATSLGASQAAATTDYTAAKAGDIVDVRIGDVLPTQPSLGYDEVYYKLGRYTLGKDALSKAYGDWCEASGLEDVATQQNTDIAAGLKNVPTTPAGTAAPSPAFTCTLAPGAETDASKALMKTVVIGPNNTLWLTDGHHTLTALSTVGGLDMHIRLRVLDNLSSLDEKSFYATMATNKWMWLKDASGTAIQPCQLPKSVGLKNFADDKYRGLLYFARDVAYSAEGAIPFQEFYWGAWAREQHDAELGTWDRTNFDAYIAQMTKLANMQVALPAGSTVYGGFTKEQLRAFDVINAKELGKASRPYSDKKPGKIGYMIEYKNQHPETLAGSPITGPQPCVPVVLTPAPTPTPTPTPTPEPAVIENTTEAQQPAEAKPAAAPTVTLADGGSPAGVAGLIAIVALAGGAVMTGARRS